MWAEKKKAVSECPRWAPLVVQWLRVHLPMQGTQIWSLVWEDPAGCKRQLSLNYWGCTWAPTNHSYRSLHALEPVLYNKRGHHNENPAHYNCRAAPRATSEEIRITQSTLRTQRTMAVSRQSTSVTEFWAELAAFFVKDYFYLKGQMTDRL